MAGTPAVTLNHEATMSLDCVLESKAKKKKEEEEKLSLRSLMLPLICLGGGLERLPPNFC